MSTRGMGSAVCAAATAVALLAVAGTANAFPKPKYPVEMPPQGQNAPPPPAAKPSPPPQPAPQTNPSRPVVQAPRGAPDTLVYTVVRGDTLTGVGRRFTVGVGRIAQFNGIDPASGLAAGTKLRLPPGAHDGGKDPYASGPVAGEPAPVVQTAQAPSRQPVRTAETGFQPVTGLRPAITPPASAPPQAASAYANPADVAALGRGKFAWPVKGDILSPYNSSRTDLGNDGLNIEAPAGTGVRASADGYVIYAGDYPGFGNLVLIKHADGWVTTYGHLQTIEVHMKDHVDQGQEIGRVGQTGGVTTPQLHFEIRYSSTPKEKAKPVDPDLLLPH